VISPATMLGIERGNIDLIVFSILTAASIVASKARRVGEFLLAAAILATACLKLYPIASIVCFLSTCRRTLPFGFPILALFLCYIYLIREQLYYVANNTPDFAWRSFGYKTVFIALIKRFIDPEVRLDPAGFLAPIHLPSYVELIARLVLLVGITASILLA